MYLVKCFRNCWYLLILSKLLWQAVLSKRLVWVSLLLISKLGSQGLNKLQKCMKDTFSPSLLQGFFRKTDLAKMVEEARNMNAWSFVVLVLKFHHKQTVEVNLERSTLTSIQKWALLIGLHGFALWNSGHVPVLNTFSLILAVRKTPQQLKYSIASSHPWSVGGTSSQASKVRCEHGLRRATFCGF